MFSRRAPRATARRQRVDQAGAEHDRGAVLIVMEHRDVAALDQRVLDLEALRRRDVLEVDAAEGGGDAGHGIDDVLRFERIDLDIEHIDIGKLLEQHRLAFHDRLAGERAAIAEPEHRGAVGDHRHQVALGGVAVGILRILLDREHRLGDSRRVRERELRNRVKRLGDFCPEFSRTRELVIVQRGLLEIFDHGFAQCRLPGCANDG
jgi:hypothetical protein